MLSKPQLTLQSVDLAPGAEWAAPLPGWTIVHPAVGVLYCFSASTSELGLGELILVPPALPALFRASQIGPARLDYFEFQPELLGSLLTLPEHEEFTRLAGEMSREVHRRPVHDPVAKLLGELCADPPTDNPLLERCQLLALVARLLPVTPCTAAHGGHTLARFSELIQRLPESELVHRSPGELAALCGCSPRHFARLFRARFGVSVRDKQTRLRLEKARQLLSESDAKVVQVAQDSGYRHLGLFNAMFKKHFGQTPTELRRAGRTNPRPRTRRTTTQSAHTA